MVKSKIIVRGFLGVGCVLQPAPLFSFPVGVQTYLKMSQVIEHYTSSDQYHLQHLPSYSRKISRFNPENPCCKPSARAQQALVYQRFY